MSTLAVPATEGTTTTVGTTTTLVPVAVPRTFYVDPQIQNVAVLLVLGVLGTLLNVALFAGALTRPRMPGSLGCAPPLAAALAQFAFGGLIESTITIILAAAYSGGGLTTTALNPNEISHPAKSALIAALFFVSTWYAWSMVSVMAAAPSSASLGLLRFLILVGMLVSAAVGAAVGYYVGIEKANISSTVLVPRLKLLAIPEALRWSIAAVSFALPWALWLMFAILAGFKSKNPSDKVFQFGSETPPSTAAIVSTIVILYLGLRVPYEILSLLQGPRPPTLHSAMAWARFSFAVAAPILVLGSARRFKAALLAAFVCCSRRRRSVSPPEDPQADGGCVVPAACPVLFQAPGGVYLRKVRYNHHPTAPGFNYCLCDIESEKIQQTKKWDNMKLLMRSSAFLD